jgi:sulfite dehydrogenase (quinone) subunit SoeC
MHPARPLVAFTTLTGLGFGLMAWLGMLQTGHPGWVAAVFALLACALAGGGLAALRRALGTAGGISPSLARRRTSWVRLAGTAAAAFAVYVAVWLVLDTRPPLLGWVVAALAVAALAATAGLCAGIDGRPAGPAPLTLALFVASGLAGGALLAGASVPSIWSLAALALIEPAHWLVADRQRHAPAALHDARPKETAVLRVLGLGCAALLPLALLLAFPFKHGLAALVVTLHLAGMVALRWLLFAPPGHPVGLGGGTRYG